MQPKLPSNILELCFNLWPVVEEESGLVYAYMGKIYALRGTMQEKLQVLKALSADDHVTVSKRKLPTRFTSHTNEGEVSGLASMKVVNDPASNFWEELFEVLAAEMPSQIRWLGGRSIETRLPLSDSPLCVVTPLLETLNGVLVPHT
jgi:hypothetical protein